MKYRKPFHIAAALCVVLIGMVFVLLFAVQWQTARYISRGETIRELGNEIRWQRYEADKAKRKTVSLPELEFLTGVMETRDRDLYAVAKAAWKWGRVYMVSPFLIMAVAHRESNFNPAARSYDSDGLELACGIMQINYRIWRDELRLDRERLLSDIDYNVQQGVIILRHYLDRNPGDISKALWRYWGGQGEAFQYPPRVLESKYFEAIK